MIQETCPKCGGNIFNSFSPVVPAIHIKQCTSCRSKWKYHEKTIKQVFNPEGWEEVTK